MMSRLYFEPSRGPTTREAGTYSWNLATNTVMASASIAQLFDLPPDRVRRGLPIERFIEKVHAEDRGAVARAIHEAIISGSPYQQTYRVIDGDGKTTRVIAYGQCFRDPAGTPSQYAGMIFPVSNATADCPSTALLRLCQTARNAAESANNHPVSQLLELAVASLTLPEAAPITAAVTRH